MIDLFAYSGLPISLDNTGKIIFSKDVVSVTPSVRKLYDMIDVYQKYDEKLDLDMYYMYRNVHSVKDIEIVEHSKYRYDLTVIKPGKIGSEFIKTLGHYHSKDNKDKEFSEIYEVIHGAAIFILQSKVSNKGSIENALVIKADAGSIVFIPPGYGHITVNIGDNFLVISNMVSKKCESIYDDVKNYKGGAFLVYNENNTQIIKKSKFYNSIKHVNFIETTNKLNLYRMKSLYEIFRLV